MQCPVCKTDLQQAGRTFACKGCQGAWVRDEVLVPLLEQSTNELVELPWQANTEAHSRACPECSAAMATVKLGSVALDRCASHGVWFDKHELSDLLAEAKQFRAAEPAHQSLLQRLRKLF